MVRRRRDVVRGATALAVALAVVVGAAAPAGAQTAPFITGAAVIGTDFTGAPGMVVVAGDDNLITLGPSVAAIFVRTLSGADTFVSANTGASWVTYTSTLQLNGNPTLDGMAGFAAARLAVGALGMNDARIITQSPAQYNALAHLYVMGGSVGATLQHTDCVLLVNVQPRPGNPNVSVAAVNAVNANMQTVASMHPGKVFVADWKTYSAGQTTWFQPNSNQLTHLGSGAYGEFVANQANDVLDVWGCA